MLTTSVILALFSLAVSKSPLVINSSTMAFSREHTVTGSVMQGDADGLVITVLDEGVTKLKASLTVTAGDADLFIVTKINKQDIVWASGLSGDDFLEILDSDSAFTDGLGLQRTFAIVVAGY